VSADRRVAGAAFVIGIMAGMLVWSGWMFRWRRQLFDRSTVRRLAALGYVEGQPSIEGARLLRDYVAWETRPALRRRGERALRKMEHYLE
jgi:hypothetical protein